MRVLIITEPASIHAARWINQFKGLGWDIHITSGVANFYGLRSELELGTVHTTKMPAVIPPGVSIEICEELKSGTPADALANLIRKLKPDLIHSHGLCINWSNRCAPVYEALEAVDPERSIPWLYSSWGADLDYFARLLPDQESMRPILGRVDFYLSECERDLRLARQMGFEGKFLGYLPVFGGVTWDNSTMNLLPPSKRKGILIKGRDIGDLDPIGRASTVVHALIACTDACKGYTIEFCQTARNVGQHAETLAKISGLNVVTHYENIGHEEMIKKMSNARVMISLTINDGLPSFLVEGISLGAFPIHSDLESIREWIEDGKNGALVPAADAHATAIAIRRALTDDALVDNAANFNERLTREKLSFADVRNRSIQAYSIASSTQSPQLNDSFRGSAHP